MCNYSILSTITRFVNSNVTSDELLFSLFISLSTQLTLLSSLYPHLPQGRTHDNTFPEIPEAPLSPQDVYKRQAVKSLGFDVSIKWPNDVVVSHKKICGILTEMGVRDGKIDYAVIGVGINVNIKEFPEEMVDKATSLYLESGKEFDRSQIPGLVMEAFEEYYEKFAATCDLSGLKEEYESILANYNQPVRVLAKEPYEGVARGITDGGELLVEKTDGTIVAVSAGEVSVRGLYSLSLIHIYIA